VEFFAVGVGECLVFAGGGFAAGVGVDEVTRRFGGVGDLGAV
jgi:hypothetical protein